MHLLDLPDCILEQAFLHLHSRQRARLAAVCKRFGQVCDGSASLWAEIQESLSTDRVEQAESFKRWLGLRDRRVRRLALHVMLADTASFPGSIEANNRVYSTARAALNIMAGSLEELEVLMGGVRTRQLSLDNLLEGLSALKKARIFAEVILVKRPLASTSRLRKLALHCARLSVRAGACSAAGAWLPPRLEKLSIDCLGQGLPPGLGAATSLRGLAMHDTDFRGADLDCLARLTGLLELQLNRCALAAPPSILTAITVLRVLYLPQNAFNSISTADWAPLQHLPRLAFLNLSCCSLTTLPPSVTGLTCLQGLHLQGNVGLGTLPPGPYLQHLQELALDWAVLFACHATLAQHAASLTGLIAAGRHTAAGGTAGVQREQRVGTLLRTLAALPALRIFTDAFGAVGGTGEDQGAKPGEAVLNADIALCLLRLGRACPRLELGVVEDGGALGWSAEDLLPAA